MSLLSFIALGLLALSGLLIDAHRRKWHDAQSNAELDERNQRAARAEYARRLRASGLIGAIGALLIVRPLVPERPLWFTAYLLLMVLMCAAMLILALVDGFASSLKVRRVRRETESLQDKLERELQAARDRADESSTTPSDR